MSLDDYDVIRELGRGGMAVVHLARQRDLQRLVALKELGGFNARDPAFAERFLRESRLAGSLNHANIVTVYEYFEDGGVPYIAMELIEGGSLRPMISELTLPKVARVLEDLLAAVGHAGRAGIVHRDLKHENVLITKDGHLKVADFGIAKAAAGGQKGLTSEGMTVGTPEYMSPEQALARDVGPQSDLYSIGCMTFEMLTGRLPYTGDSQGALLVSHVTETVPDVRTIDPLIPDAIAQWVARMTEKKPEDRFPDADAAWDAFEEAVLEYIGPLWRRDATLVPLTAIDLSDIPPQTSRPMRLPGRPVATPLITGAMTGYQTYHAPAALHEVLGIEPEAAIAPVIATPPPRPAVRPSPSKQTPPPLRAAPPKAEPKPEPEKKARKVPVGAIVAVGLVAAVLAFVVGMSSGGSAKAASAGGDGFVLKAPSGWKKADAGLIPGLGSGAVALAPAGAPAGEGVAAARLPIAQAASLARRDGAGDRVQLAAGEAVRIAGGGPVRYLLPTDAGAVIVGCSTGATVHAACADVAGSVQLTRGRALPPGPTDAGASALRAAATRLRKAISNPAQDLGSAKSATAQATAAGDLATAYRSASREVKKADVGALANAGRDQLAAALKAVGDGWARYARGARSHSAGAVAGASGAIHGARSRVKHAYAALSGAGYPAGGG